MLAILLLDEGSMITFVVNLVRLGVLAASAATMVMTLQPKFWWLRVTGLLLAALLLLVSFLLLNPSPYADPNGRYVVMALSVPVVVGLLGIGWHARRARPTRKV
ncbi:hypothetical protein HER32_19510 [Hymenobacter sp. BT18]|uniref:hypothetical protein n=1 Tax=Hymenobacter sp. BT18 TaxID=2835648 RepID=UPI00143E99B4|nr:hypothetical protein [Hymenobacter sp. BT18]QIX63241.1 hypothetical protein HER32_19510 [Hymenobacter sp. BT18]